MLGGSDGAEEGGEGVAGDAVVVLLVGHLPSGPRHTGEPEQGCGEDGRQGPGPLPLGRGRLVPLGAGAPVLTRSRSGANPAPLRSHLGRRRRALRVTASHNDLRHRHAPEGKHGRGGTWGARAGAAAATPGGQDGERHLRPHGDGNGNSGNGNGNNGNGNNGMRMGQEWEWEWERDREWDRDMNPAQLGGTRACPML